MEIPLDALCATVAETKGKVSLCMLDPLQDLIRTVCGEAPGPTEPFFLRDCIVAGLVVLQQYPILDGVQFPDNIAKNSHPSWLKQEQVRLGLRDSYDIQTPAAIVLTDTYSQATKIAVRTIRSYTS